MSGAVRKAMLLSAALIAGPAAAQVQGLENFTLAQPAPTPTAEAAPTPTPSATPAPNEADRAKAAASAAAASALPAGGTPAAEASEAASASAGRPRRPAPVATTAAPSSPTPVASDAPAAAPVTAPTATPTGAVDPALTPRVERGPVWPWVLAALALLAAVAGFLWWRRERRPVEQWDTEPEPVPVAEPWPDAEPAPPTVDALPVSAEPAAPKPSAPMASAFAGSVPGGLVTSSLKPVVEIALQPLRGGVDTQRAAVEFALKVTNSGRSPAGGVTVEAWLLSASHETASDLARAFGSPLGNPLLPPFDLPAGSNIDLEGQVSVPRDTLATIVAGERRSFVPVVAVRVGFANSRGAVTMVTAAFLVGVDKAGRERLAPLSLERDGWTGGLAARRYEH